MANITTAEARLLWQLVYLSGGSIEKPDLEERAAELGIHTVSDRMYRHLRALYLAGYDHYVPVNRFDVLRASAPFTNESANGRYRVSPVELAAQVMVIRPMPVVFFATASQVSDAGLRIVISDPEVGARLARGRHSLRPGEYIRVDFLEGAVPWVDARVVEKVEVDPTGESWAVEAEFDRLRSVAEFTDGEPMGTTAVTVRLLASDGGPVAADVLSRRLFRLLEAAEDVRALLNDVAAGDEGPEGPVRAYPARIERVFMDSPLEIVLAVPMGVGVILAGVWAVIKWGPNAYKTIQEGRLAGSQVAGQNLQNEAQAEENQTKALLHSLVRAQLEEQGLAVSDDPHRSRLFDSVASHLMGELSSLTREEVTDVEVSETSSGESLGPPPPTLAEVAPSISATVPELSPGPGEEPLSDSPPPQLALPLGDEPDHLDPDDDE